MNNVFELERISNENNMMVRPYLRDGEIVRLYPDPPGKSALYSWFLRNSHFSRFIESKLARGEGKYTQPMNAQEILSSPEKSSLARSTTIAILKKLRARVKDTPIVGFTIGQTMSSDFLVEAANEVGIEVYRDVDAAVKQARKDGETVTGHPYNGYWNDRGHAIAGRKLASMLFDIGCLGSLGG
jgi:hypothetical protein